MYIDYVHEKYNYKSFYLLFSKKGDYVGIVQRRTIPPDPFIQLHKLYIRVII